MQGFDVDLDKPSLLILGDSFVQGQGFGNWTDDLTLNNNNNLQIINGAFLGAGPMQFLEIEKYISKMVKIEKVLFIYIGDDFRRDIYSHDKKRLNCLSNHNLCDGTESFYGFPLGKKNPTKFLKFLSNRKNQDKSEINFKKIRRYIKSKIYNLYIVNIPISFLRSKFYKTKNKKN